METEKKKMIEIGPEINTGVETEGRVGILEKTVEIEIGIIEATLTGAETIDHGTAIPEADLIITTGSQTETIDLANQFWMNLAEI